MEIEENFIKVISEEEGKELLKEDKIIFEEKGIFLTLLIKDKINIDYIKNITKLLNKNKKETFVVTLISIFNENEEEKNKILDESIGKLKKEVNSIIIVPNNEKDIFVVKNKLKDAAEKIKKFIDGRGFISIDFYDLKTSIIDIVGIYSFGSASGELKEKEVVENLYLSIPERYKKKIGNHIIKIETSTNVKLSEAWKVGECISKKLEKGYYWALYPTSINKKFKNRIDAYAILEIDECKEYFNGVVYQNQCENLAEDLKRLHEEMVNLINEDLEKKTNNVEDEKIIDEAVEKVMKNYDEVLRRLAK